MHLHSQFGISIEEEGENIPSFPPLPLRDRQASPARRGGRPPLPCRAKPHSSSVTPGWCQLCAVPVLWTVPWTGTSSPNLGSRRPHIEKHSQKCEFTKSCFHCLLFHNLFVFLISSCWLNDVALATFAEVFHLPCWHIHAPAHKHWVTSLTPIPALLRRASSHLRLEPGDSVLHRCNPLTHMGITHPDVSSSQALLFWDSSHPWATDEMCSKNRPLTLPSYTLPCLSWSWINSSLWQRQRSVTILEDKTVWEVCRGLCKGLWGKATGQGLTHLPSNTYRLQRWKEQSRKLDKHQVKGKWK